MKTTGLVLLVCSVAFLSFVPLVDGSYDYQKEAALARQFLVSLYDDDAGLLKESPLLQQNYLGLQSDNYLASVALDGHYPDEAARIRTSLINLHYTGNCKYEAVFNGQSPALPFIIQKKQIILNHSLGEDAFTREPLGEDWSNTGGRWGIEDMALKGTDGKNICYFNRVQMADGDIIVRLRLTEGAYIGVVLRMRANDEYLVSWLTTVGGGEVKLQEQNHTGCFDVDKIRFDVEMEQEYMVRFELAGTVYRLYIDELDLENEGAVDPILQGSSPINTTAGWCGVIVDDGTVGYFDDWEITDYRIYNMFDMEERQTDYEEYSDLCLVASAVKWNVGAREEAIRLFEAALLYFDGTGFHDTHLHTPYLAYQLGLCLSVANLIDYDLGPLGADVKAILWSLQRDDGGIPTHYTGFGVPYGSGEPNCETTCFAVLSTKEPYDVSDNTFIQLLRREVLWVVGAVVLIGALFKFVRRAAS